MSLVIVIGGYILPTQNLNARMQELGAILNRRIDDQNAMINQRFADFRSEIKDLLRAELAAIRAEMAKNHSELLARIAESETRMIRP